MDNTIQRIYGGDQFGNLWRFDINNQIPARRGRRRRSSRTSRWARTSSPSRRTAGRPRRTAADDLRGDGDATSGASDRATLNQQSLYAIVDKLTGTGIGNARTETTCPLVQQSLTVVSGTRARPPRSGGPHDQVRLVPGLQSRRRQHPRRASERRPQLQLGVLAVGTNVPETSVCTVGGSSWVYFFDYTTRLVHQHLDEQCRRLAHRQRPDRGWRVELVPPGGSPYFVVTGSDDSHIPFFIPRRTGSTQTGRRVMWRELLN